MYLSLQFRILYTDGHIHFFEKQCSISYQQDLNHGYIEKTNHGIPLNAGIRIKKISMEKYPK